MPVFGWSGRMWCERPLEAAAEPFEDHRERKPWGRFGSHLAESSEIGLRQLTSPDDDDPDAVSAGIQRRRHQGLGARAADARNEALRKIDGRDTHTVPGRREIVEQRLVRRHALL